MFAVSTRGIIRLLLRAILHLVLVLTVLAQASPVHTLLLDEVALDLVGQGQPAHGRHEMRRTNGSPAGIAAVPESCRPDLVKTPLSAPQRAVDLAAPTDGGVIDRVPVPLLAGPVAPSLAAPEPAPPPLSVGVLPLLI